MWININRGAELKINGWTLVLATAHGIRVWQDENGLVEWKGLEGLSSDQIDDLVEWFTEFTKTGEMPPVKEWLVSGSDISDMLMMDYDEFAAEEK